MEAPKEIYLQQKKWSGLIDGYYNAPIWEDTHDNIKYIRADLVELTWEDMFKIVEIDMTLFERGATQKDVENHFKEVLRRFNEYKQNAREARSGTRKGKGI